MGAKARKAEVKEVVRQPPRYSPPLRVRLVGVRAWLMPHLDTLAHESAKSIGKHMGPILKWSVVAAMSSGSVKAVVKLITAILVASNGGTFP
jgi:hypothetical protein